jgi:hypothetical protein
MTNVNWIDLDAAAGWLSINPEGVMNLIHEGVLGSKRITRDTVAVWAGDVKSLARFWIPKRPRRRRQGTDGRRKRMAAHA